MPKKSTIYLDLSPKVYTIQVTSPFYNEKKARDLVRNLKKEYKIPIYKLKEEKCWKKEKPNSCRKRLKEDGINNIFIEYSLRNNMPNNGYEYKVNYGKYEYKDIKNAKRDKRYLIEKYKKCKKAWIKPYPKD